MKPPERPTRSEPREIAELKRLKQEQPDLAAAADLQIALLELQRRVQNRVALPRLDFKEEDVRRLQEEGRPLLRLQDFPLDWTDVRLAFREVSSLLHRFGELETADLQALQRLGREDDLTPHVYRWYAAAAAPDAAAVEPGMPPLLEEILRLAMRPFLTRAADAIVPRLDLSGWHRNRCPLCAGEPEFAEITPAATRLLICGRCTARWEFDPLACPFCSNTDRGRIKSFAGAGGQYRIYACDACGKYIKAFDGRRSSRPVMLSVDLVATLPLDAAVIQRGYHA
jgi:formate dehydrogenase maturation protein FdhE